MLTSVVGTNWGDEGKGRMVDMLSEAYDVVVRYQGGNNAGHTVVNEYGKTVLNLLPSGIMRKNTANILGPGMVVDLEHLSKETDAIRKRGVLIYEYLPGFHCDIGACRRLEDLPQAARDYIAFVESAVGCPTRCVSVGAERDAIIWNP